MPSAELTSTQARQEPVAGLHAPHPARRSRGSAVFHAIALWLLRALTDSAGAWALAAGAPLDASNAEAIAQTIRSTGDALGAEAEVYLGYGSGGPVPGDS